MTRRGRAPFRLAALALWVALLFVAAPAAAKYTPPPLRGHVVDTAGLLSSGEILTIDRKLDSVRQRYGFAIVAFLVGSLDGADIDDVAFDTFNAWGVGDRGKDDGVLLVIAPKERRVRIETGKGTGGALTDLQANDIIRRVIAPELQAERYGRAVDRGTMAIAEALLEDAQGDAGDGRAVRVPPVVPQGQPVSLVEVGFIFGGILLFVVLLIVSPTFRSLIGFVFQMLLLSGFRGGGGGGGGGGGSGYGGGGGRSGGGGSSDSY